MGQLQLGSLRFAQQPPAGAVVLMHDVRNFVFLISKQPIHNGVVQHRTAQMLAASDLAAGTARTHMVTG